MKVKNQIEFWKWNYNSIVGMEENVVPVILILALVWILDGEDFGFESIETKVDWED